MRFIIAILGIFIVTMAVSFEAYSQSEEREGRRVYGGDRGSTGPNIFNSPGSAHGTGGPISLKQMIQGRDRAAAGDRYAYYGDRLTSPYSINPADYAGYKSAAQIQRERDRRNQLAQEREKENIAGLVNFDASDETAANSYRPTNVRVSPRGRPGSVYIKRKKDFDVPKKVFRSIY